MTTKETSGDARKVVCRAPNWGMTPDGRCTVCGHYPAAPAQAEPREPSPFIFDGRLCGMDSPKLAAPAAQEGCPRCGKVTGEGDVHTCSPQVQDGRDLDALIERLHKWGLHYELRAQEYAAAAPIREPSHELSQTLIGAADAIAALRAELAETKRERQARNAIDPVTRLHNICDAMAGDRADSPYSQEAWAAQDEAYQEKCREIADLRARAERAEVDAGRYRYLREADDVPLLRGASDLLTGTELDAAIDAAIRARTQGGDDADK